MKAGDTRHISISFPWAAALFVLFLTLKLTGQIDWSWWLVTAPLWIPVGLLVSVTIILLLISAVIALFGLALIWISDHV